MTNGLEIPRHTQADLLPLLGLSAGSFQNWVNRGVVALSERNPGVGRRRLFSDLDAMRLLTTVELTRLGIGPSMAADFAAKVIEPRARAKAEERRRIEEAGEHTYGTAQLAIFYYEDGEMKYVVAETTDQWAPLARLR